MRILIIGGTGLISTPLTRFLLEAGHEVTLFNRGHTEVRVPAHQKLKVVKGDRKDDAAFRETIHKLPPFDVVVDMVCFHPAEAEGLVKTFAGRCRQVVFCSTVDVYTKPPHQFPVREDQARYPISEYGKNKARCEDILMEADARGDFAVTSIRPAHTYGEGGVLIHTFGWSAWFVDRIRKGLPVIVHGDGQSLWVSCHVDDVARAFVGAIGNSNAYGKAYSVTGEEWLTWDRYHQIIAKALGVPCPELVHIPSELLLKLDENCAVTYYNFQYTNIFDNAAAKRDLGFRYSISFLEGAERVIRWQDAKGMICGGDAQPKYDRIITEWKAASASLIQSFRAE